MMHNNVKCKLLLVVPIYASYRTFLKGLASWLVAREWEVHLATNLKGANIDNDVVILHDLPIPRGASPLRLFIASRALKRIIKTVNPNIVHAHFSLGILCLSLFDRVKKELKVGTFHGLRFSQANGMQYLLFKIIECFSIMRLDKSWVLTADDYAAVPNFLQKQLALQDGYGIGCDIEHFSASRFTSSQKNKLRSSLGISPGEHVFIFVGRLTEFKGFPLALFAFLQLQKEYRDIHFLVLGEPDPQHPVQFPDLCAIPGVSHVGWQDDPAPYMAISNCMVFPSEREGMPVCVMEAISMSLPVIGCDYRGVRELVVDEDTGLIVRRDVVSVCIAMRRTIKEPELMNRLAMGGELLRAGLDRRNFFETIVDLEAEKL